MKSWVGLSEHRAPQNSTGGTPVNLALTQGLAQKGARRGSQWPQALRGLISAGILFWSQGLLTLWGGLYSKNDPSGTLCRQIPGQDPRLLCPVLKARQTGTSTPRGKTVGVTGLGRIKEFLYIQPSVTSRPQYTFMTKWTKRTYSKPAVGCAINRQGHVF